MRAGGGCRIKGPPVVVAQPTRQRRWSLLRAQSVGDVCDQWAVAAAVTFDDEELVIGLAGDAVSPVVKAVAVEV